MRFEKVVIVIELSLIHSAGTLAPIRDLPAITCRGAGMVFEALALAALSAAYAAQPDPSAAIRSWGVTGVGHGATKDSQHMQSSDETPRKSAPAAGLQQSERLRLPGIKDAKTPQQAAVRDFLHGEVWTRPGLDRRSRFIISIAGAADRPGPEHMLDNYVTAALELEELKLAELREIALHLGAYAGFSPGARLDEAITRSALKLGLEEMSFRPLHDETQSPAERHARGAESFQRVTGTPGPPPATPFLDAGVLNYVFAEVWTRPALDHRSRRLISLVAAANSQAPAAVREHVYAAMASGELTRAEMQEFVLHYATIGGFTRASTMEGLVLEMAGKIARGEPLRGEGEGSRVKRP